MEQPSTSVSTKTSEHMRKAISAAVEYNQLINQERKERGVCMDLQTCTTHYPIGLGQENRQLVNNIKKGRVRGKIGKYPVSLVPTQYQDWYIKYSSTDLKYLPLNTVIFGPVSMDRSKQQVPANKLTTNEEEEEIDDSSSGSSDSDSSSDESCCSLNGVANESRTNEEQDASDSGSSSSCESEEGVEGANSKSTTSKKSGPVCKECKKSSRNKCGVHEQLVHCSECSSSCHPSCLELSTEMAEVIRSYRWQCTDCKSCVTCNKSTDEDTLMICDRCDRAFHCKCTGLQSIPVGEWICKLCSKLDCLRNSIQVNGSRVSRNQLNTGLTKSSRKK